MLKSLYIDLYKNNSEAMMMWYTIIILFISELPVIIFTILDYIKLEKLQQYRIRYNRKRIYPNNMELWDGICEFSKCFCLILLPLSMFGICMYNYLGLKLYNMDVDFSYMEISVDIVLVLLMSEVLFYGMHRIFHIPFLYKHIHKHHHKYKEPFALINHYLHPVETVLFFIPPVLPGIILNTHIVTMWITAIMMNWNGIFIHSGYDIRMFWLSKDKKKIILPGILEHDLHHKYFNYNYGATFLFMDYIFGTYRSN